MYDAIMNNLIVWLPLGMIGVWRWTTWMIKFTMSAFYKDPSHSDSTMHWKVAIAVPLKNEPTESFQRLLDCAIREKVDQIRVVLYHDEYENIALLDRYIDKYRGCVDIKYGLTEIAAKRPALTKAISMVDLNNADVVFLMDSDTYLGEGSKKAILSAFDNPRVGGVTIMQRVWQPSKLLHHLFDIRLFLRYTQDLPGQALGDRVSVLSGRCAAYLAKPMVEQMGPRLMHEHWMGIHKTGGGDDKWFTTQLHDLGYHTTMVRNAVVYTLAADTLNKYLSQSLRWSRNTWYSDLRALLTRRWMWSSPLLLFYTLDRTFGFLVVLIPVWLFAIAFFTASWEALGVLLLWWFISRSLKIGLYLLDTKRFDLVYPYIAMNYVENVLKIHALFTLKNNSWMTRGERGVSALKYVAYCATGTFVMAVGLVVALVLN